jgi:hypothetical protein
VLKEKELVKAKGTKDWQWKKHLWNSFIETIRQLQHGGIEKQPATTNKKTTIKQLGWIF